MQRRPALRSAVSRQAGNKPASDPLVAVREGKGGHVERGAQVAPGLYKLVDLPDLQGLLAPKPLLIDIGVYDSCFLVDTAMACYRQVEKIYRAAGVRMTELPMTPDRVLKALQDTERSAV